MYQFLGNFMKPLEENADTLRGVQQKLKQLRIECYQCEKQLG